MYEYEYEYGVVEVSGKGVWICRRLHVRSSAGCCEGGWVDVVCKDTAC